MIERLEQRIAARSARLAPYVTAGDGGLDTTRALLRALDRRDVACVEVGFPFSDPIADGVELQAANERALAAGATYEGVLHVASEFRAASALPLIAMGYANSFLRPSWSASAGQLARAGFDGWLVADLPLEEATEMRAAALAHDLAPIFFASPTSSDERIARAAAASRGFVYAIARTGVTGAATELDTTARDFVRRAKRACGTRPLALGFGLRDAAGVRAALSKADLAIIGSALVARVHREFERTCDPSSAAAAAASFLDSLTQGAAP